MITGQILINPRWRANKSVSFSRISIGIEAFPMYHIFYFVFECPFLTEHCTHLDVLLTEKLSSKYLVYRS